MARKKEQHKNVHDRKSSLSKEKDAAPPCGLPVFSETGKSNVRKEDKRDDEHLRPLVEDLRGACSSGSGGRKAKKSGKSQKRNDQGMDAKPGVQEPVLDKVESAHGMETGKSESLHASELLSGASDIAQESSQSEDVSGLLQLSDILGLESLKISFSLLLKAWYEWLERQRPLLLAATNGIQSTCGYVKMKYAEAYPVALKWLGHLGNILLLVSMVWLDCFLRGADSFLRMGTTSFFSIIWFSVLSVIAMVGMLKFLLIVAGFDQVLALFCCTLIMYPQVGYFPYVFILILLPITFSFVACVCDSWFNIHGLTRSINIRIQEAAAALVGTFVGFIIAVLVLAVSGVVILWLYGSFWTTSFVIALAGLSFVLRHERFALLLTTAYSVYCAWSYVGWFGMLVGLNLSFISSDVLVYFLRSNMDTTPGQTAGAQSQQSFFSGKSYQGHSENGQDQPADRSAGVPSTSGADSDVTSEDEVVRLLNCVDHYSALGLSRYEQIDVSVLKREYRKKAMLVHPDKNMGNEKAAEAFKRLQNAYEVLLDSVKRKAYDDELRREELLSYFQRFQSIPQKGRGGFFPNGFAPSEGGTEEPLGEARRISCKKCGGFHIWIQTHKSKSGARWCQDCKDYHQAKDGDGWVEQSSQPFLFGMLQKVNAPAAYVCADSKVYDATEWYICQGMKCPANSHKPSFHVNTNVTRPSHGRGPSSSQRGGIPAPNAEDKMTEEEFFEWLQDAVNSGVFDNFAANGSDGGPTGFARKNSGASSSGGGSSSNVKRKKKGKRQW